jgi:subtilase family serine protease
MDYQPANLQSVELPPIPDASPAGLGAYTSSYLTPPQIATAYNIPVATGNGVKIGIFSFGGGFYQSDLNKSFTDLQTAGLIDSKLSVPTISQVLLDGQTGSYAGNTGASGENTVDIYCTACMAPKAAITIYIGNSYGSMMTAAIADGMNIITISWATSEYTFDEQYFQQAANAKIAVLAASGDWGSTLGNTGTSLVACYPSSSPYVLSVGGTKLTLNANSTRLSESDDNRDSSFSTKWGGGGGISSIFTRPSFQPSSLRYTPITNGVTGIPTALTMRGVPDISAPMNVYVFYENGSISAAGGTSLSSPVLAGILARYMELTGIKRSSPDWNAIAYANPTAFFDIIVGTNNTVITSGYAGTTDWDCVTGLGPPIGTSIYQVIRLGVVFPKQNYGFRSTTGPTYPRRTIGAR